MWEEIKKLREKRARLLANAREERGKITDKTPEGEATEIEQRFDTMLTEAENIGKEIERLERLDRLESEDRAATDRAPMGNGEAGAAGEHRNGGDQPMEYRDAFYHLMVAAGDLGAVLPEARAALRRGQVNLAQLAAGSPEQRAQTVGNDGAGGFLVPDEGMKPLIKAMAAWGPMFDDGFATVLNTSSGSSMPIPGVDDTAGRASQNNNEGQKLADTGTKDVLFTRKTLEDYLFDTEWLKFSLQLFTNGVISMEQLLGELLGERLGRTANDVLTNGTGVGEPLGISVGASLGLTVAGASAVTADEIQGLIHSVDPAYRASPKFGMMFNDNTLLALHRLKDGQGNYLLQEGGDGVSRLIIGAVKSKYTVNQAMADMGTGNRSMVAGDMGKYFVRKIGNTVIGTSRDSNFWPHFGVAGYQRLDGTVAEPVAIRALQHP